LSAGSPEGEQVTKMRRNASEDRVVWPLTGRWRCQPFAPSPSHRLDGRPDSRARHTYEDARAADGLTYCLFRGPVSVTSGQAPTN